MVLARAHLRGDRGAILSYANKLCYKQLILQINFTTRAELSVPTKNTWRLMYYLALHLKPVKIPTKGECPLHGTVELA